MAEVGFEAFYQRISKAVGVESQTELARLLGVNRSAVTQAKNRNTVPAKWVWYVSREYGLNPDWLEKGTGSMRLSEVEVEESEYKKIPKVAARLCAGHGSLEVEGNVEEYRVFPWNWLQRKGNPDQMVLMDVFGNSMEPEIKEGDTALIDQARKDIVAGGIYAVGVEDTVMVKRIEKRPGALVLISDNTDYSPIYLQGEEAADVRVIGKVLWVSREYR